MFDWIKNTINTGIVTFAETNITFNNLLAKNFADIRWVRVGISPEKKMLAVKPVQKKDIESNRYPKDELYKISIGTSYARITSKELIRVVSSTMKKDIIGSKFDATYDDAENMLVINLKKERID